MEKKWKDPPDKGDKPVKGDGTGPAAPSKPFRPAAPSKPIQSGARKPTPKRNPAAPAERFPKAGGSGGAAKPPRQATQADTGWRSGTPAPAPEQGSPGGASKPPRQATQADAGWRSSTPASTPEQGSTGGTSKPPRKATQADAGWRAAAADMLDPSNVMNQATANAYAQLDEFKAAVGKLPELVSTQGTKYQVKKALSKEGGESAILLCAAPDGQDVVAKVYYEPVNSAGSSIPARTRVLEYMGTEDGQKYTLAVQEIGLVELGGSRYYFEILPYCKDGDLSHSPPFSFDQIVDLTAYLNEALHSMHSASILHRDIKPENLYWLDGQVVIGDFGVAKLAKAGVTRTTAGTDGYRAPESVLAVSAGDSAFFFDEKCDYYSLGVTLGSLFEGRFIYKDMNAAMMTVAVRQGRLPLTRNDPHREQLENLLNGLCRYDSRYRFGYEDVKRWLVDHNYTGGVLEDEWPKSFRMFNEEYRDEKSLFEGITRDEAHWNEGKELLYKKYFENFFISFRTDLARSAQVADETWRTKQPDKGLAVFLKNLFAPGPIVWRGYTFKSLGELAEKMKASRTPAAYGEILKNRCISHWLSNTEGIQTDQQTLTLVEVIENKAQTEPELACYWFGNSFSKKKELRVCNQTVSNIGELMTALFRAPREFYLSGGYDLLMDRKTGAALYGFLYSLGYQGVIEAQWKEAQKCDEFNKAVLLLGMLDVIASKAKADTALLRDFFLRYGPLGIAVYTKQLVDRTGTPVYQGLNADGKQILSQIAAFRPAASGSVNEIFRNYAPLLELLKKLQSNLIDNPYCITAGVYESRGVLCTDLSGCFAFLIFGRSAPLGFHAWLESATGGKKL